MVMSISGKAEVVFGPEDFAQLVGQYMGREAIDRAKIGQATHNINVIINNQI